MEEFFKMYANSFTGWNSIFAGIGLVVSIATLFFAMRINKQFGNNHLRTKQIDHVCEIIEVLNKPKITITFATYHTNGGISGMGDGILLNIFEIGSYDSIAGDGPNKGYENESVLFDKDSNQIADIKKYLDHPLTPKSIADELLKLYNRMVHPVVHPRDFDYLKKFVWVSTGIWESNVCIEDKKDANLLESLELTFQTWLNLKETAIQLKRVIGQWLIDNGINENNMREDFKYYE